MQSNNNTRRHSLSLGGWTRNAATGKSDGLHPEILKLAAEVGVEAQPTGAYGPRGPARSQAFINDVFVGYYPGAWGATPWQVGPQRVCMSRRELIALLTEGVEPVETTPSARNLTEVKERQEAKAEPKAEETKAAEVKVEAVKEPTAVTPDVAAIIAAVTEAVMAALAAKKQS